MRAIAVIGAAWGDEGKGAAVDALAAANPGALVVRHNGGAQAGHTVVTPDGTRHVFSHFCSGALAGAPSYISEFFVVNPRVFCNEWHELKKTNANLKLIAHPNALVTTPLDVAINRALETRRGSERHGSVGIGFGETIERSEKGIPLYVKDLDHQYVLKQKIENIMSDWYPIRMKQLGFSISIDYAEIEEFYKLCSCFADHVFVMDTHTAICHNYDTIIFEGAQGLLLDQNRGLKFPYVTRSNTGTTNIFPIIKQLKVAKLDVIYMMRPYLTRHGAGPLPGEVEELPFKIIDETNKPGKWQGELRFAPFDKDLIDLAILNDYKSAPEEFKINPFIGISCIDQVSYAELVRVLQLNYDLGIIGYGRSRKDYEILTRKLSSKFIEQIYTAT